MPNLLASVEELRLFLDDPTIDEDRATFLLTTASGEVRAATGLLFDWTEGDVVTLDGPGTTVLLLPEVPVAAVISVVEHPGRSSELELLEDDSFDWSADGLLQRIDGARFSRRYRSYAVTYDHGFETIPDEVKAVVLRAAARPLNNPDNVRSETLGRYSYTLAGETAGVGLFSADLDTLAPYVIGGKMRAGTAAAGSGS